MSGTIAPFRERYRRALADGRLRTNLLNFQRAWRTSRDVAFGRLLEDGSKLGAQTPTFQAASEQLVAAKNAVLADPAAMRERFIAAATQSGVVVHQVETPAAAC